MNTWEELRHYLTEQTTHSYSFMGIEWVYRNVLDQMDKIESKYYCFLLSEAGYGPNL